MPGSRTTMFRSVPTISPRSFVHRIEQGAQEGLPGMTSAVSVTAERMQLRIWSSHGVTHGLQTGAGKQAAAGWQTEAVGQAGTCVQTTSGPQGVCATGGQAGMCVQAALGPQGAGGEMTTAEVV